MLPWLLAGGVGPALFGLPMNWPTDALLEVALRWFRRQRGNDDLNRLVQAATGTSVDLTRTEFDAVRDLLEDQETWSVARRETVEDLVARLASLLPPRDGRTASESRVAAAVITRGFLEFALASLDPKLFQQLMFARLGRIETGQANALDETLIALYSDLFTLLPQGPVQSDEIAKYLRGLIDWTSSDPWPRDLRLGGPVLTPASIERRRLVTVTPAGGRDLDADELARRSRRLVILGDPGSGKTWLAKRMVRRCAEEALNALTAGVPVDEVELPLYTTCRQLFAAGGDIRQAVVSSALDRLPESGGSRLATTLRMFFTERNAPTLLVIDSLDEAHGSSERLRQADTLPWRIVLTSRPSSWNHQLPIEQRDDSQLVGVLQPLRYPDDVEPFIQHWFTERPEWGKELSAKIARNPDLQQAVTVPLVLAFYCIVGIDRRLPEFRRDLYSRVIRRILTSSWRDSGDHMPDMQACLETLRGWAWSAAVSYPVSGVGTWLEDFPTQRALLGDVEREALDNVASPLGPPDIDTGMILRRFIDRSIHEHLVAEYVAGLPVDEAAESLLPHIWYDPAWGYAVPTAINMHPDRSRLLSELVCRAAGSAEVPGDLSVIDAGWEFRGLLARVAAESGEADWSTEMAELISNARVELARSGHTDDLGMAAAWRTSNRLARDALLQLVAGETRGRVVERLAIGVSQLDPTPDDLGQTRNILFRLLAHETDSWEVERLARGIAQLTTAADDKSQARIVLLGLLGRQTDSLVARELAVGIAQLEPTAKDVGRTLGMLLGLLSRQTDSQLATELARGVIQLAMLAEDKSQAGGILLELLSRQTDSQLAMQLAAGMVQLSATDKDKSQARAVLLGLLAGQTTGVAASWLAAAVAQLVPTEEDQSQARSVLLGLLSQQIDSQVATQLAAAIAQLAPTEEDKSQARDVLLEKLANPVDGWEAVKLTGGVVRLDPTTREVDKALGVLLGLLGRQTDSQVANELASGVTLLAQTQAKDRARSALLELLDRQTDGPVAAAMAVGIAGLDPTPEQARQARSVLLALLASEADGLRAVRLAGGVVQLGPTAEEARQARGVLLGLLASEADGLTAVRLAGGVDQFDPTAEETRQARVVLLGLLATETDRWEAARLVRGIVNLKPTVIDLSKWHEWVVPPSVELLAAVRHNSPLPEWLTALPSFTLLLDKGCFAVTRLLSAVLPGRLWFARWGSSSQRPNMMFRAVRPTRYTRGYYHHY